MARLGVKQHIWLLVILACAVCAALAVCGCDSYEPESSETDATAYYQEKYKVRARVAESHGLGNYSLFGYSYSGMEYVMSDGVSVVYYDSEGIFRDNRQTAEIKEAAEAFAKQEFEAIPGAVVPLGFLSVGDEPSYETYEGTGVCWHARYDGDIQAFLNEEHPGCSFEWHAAGDNYSDGRFTYDAAYDYAYGQAVEDAFLKLSRYFDLRSVAIAIVDPQAFDPEGATLFDDSVHYTLSFKGDTAASVSAVHFKPEFVRLAEGITISSATRGVTLAEGDVSFTNGAGGFVQCKVSGAAAATSSMEYYVHNDSGVDIVRVDGLDKFSLVCEANNHRNYCKFVDGATYYLGKQEDISPRVDIESVDSNKVVIRYHTFFKDRIRQVQFRTIGFAKREGSSTYETVEFRSRIVGETEDGWRCEIDIPKSAKPDNELAFQFSYNGDKDSLVQILQEVQLG